MALASRRIVGKILRYSLLPRAVSVRFGSDSAERMSGLYPLSPAERAAAAKKYNVRVEDYKPYPDDGFGWGDYPDLPSVHEDYKDPHGDWDFPEARRNYGETPHIDFDYLSRSKPAPYMEHPVPLWKQTAILGGVLATVVVALFIGHYIKLFNPAAPKQYPYNNLSVERGLGPESLENAPKHYKF